jgi:thioredoxin reductase/bacterioferritin-associated ferredoxin
MSHDLIIIGAGPAGASAAIEAAELGLRPLLLDENHAAGGQVWRARPAAPGDAVDAAGRNEIPTEGDALRARLRASSVTCAFDRRVWLAERGFVVSTLGPDGPETFTAPGLIVATGARERHVPVPGWELPGVIGLAAATILLKAARMLPGHRVVVAGVGPLLPLVAAEILSGGGTVAAVIDANRQSDWLRRPAALLSRPDLAARGAGWIARLVAAGVPLVSGHALRRIEGTDAVTRAVAGPVDGDFAPREGRERAFACDAVCYGFGLQPATEITRLLGATHAWLPSLGGWSPLVTKEQRTTVPHLYACGDGAGVLGVAAAPLRGRIAAVAAARALGHIAPARAATLLAPLHRALRRASRFGIAITALAAPRAGAGAAITAETTVCRCERLSRRELDLAIAQGAVTLNDLKSATRCGMGPCGGCICEDAAALLIAARTGHTREAIGQATARPPLHPIPLQALAGNFDYESLPMPEPAPL